MFSKETDNFGKVILNPFMEAYKLTGQAKVHGSMDFLQVLIDNQIKFLLFCHHKHTLDEYEKLISKALKNYSYMRIDGETSLEKRHENVKTFQNDENCMIALLSIMATY